MFAAVLEALDGFVHVRQVAGGNPPKREIRFVGWFEPFRTIAIGRQMAAAVCEIL
jgi:hypothetical protein